jgi:hypothetical protein
MNVFSRYLIRHLFLGFAAAAGLLLPLFTTFNLINELDDVSPGGYRWTQAVLVVLLRDSFACALTPFLALSCSELTTIDLRYFEGDLLDTIAGLEPDIALTLYTARDCWPGAVIEKQ